LYDHATHQSRPAVHACRVRRWLHWVHFMDPPIHTDYLMSITAQQLYFILDHEFTLDELRDIVNHGMSLGYSGFIYSSDLRDTWDKHEDMITDYLDGFCDDNFGQSMCAYIVEQLTFDGEDWTMQQLIEYAVLLYVELRANEIVNTVDGNW
jgi:hypothetical protein